MTGDRLALGAAAVLAAAGVLSRRGSRQVGPVPPGFTTDPWEFVHGTVLEWMVEDQDPDNVGLFHVTTNLPAVVAQGRVRSRGQLRRQGRTAAGLGGGIRDQAAHFVSVGVLRDGAERVLSATRMMAQAVHGQIDAQSALRQLNEASEQTLDVLDQAVEWMIDGVNEQDKTWRAARAYEQAVNLATQDVLAATPGFELYEALRRYEGVLANTLAEWISESWVSEDDLICGATVGFTVPAGRFRHVRPENVGLVQLAGRETARPDLVPSECELRFRSEDLALVGVHR